MAQRRYARLESEAMDKAFVGRQPIYRDGIEVFGYELLSRNDERNRAAFSDETQATSELVINTFLEIGLDQLVGRHIAFINVDRNFLLGENCRLLPKGRV